MAKSNVSTDFINFASANEHNFEEAKTQEKQARGIPFPEGYEGVAIINELKAGISKGRQQPYVAVEGRCVDEAPEYQGKKFTLGFFNIVESENITRDQSWAMMLDGLEDLGLSRETREKYGAGKDIQQCFSELQDEPHYCTFRIVKGYKDRLEAQAFACPPPEGMTGAAPPQQENTESLPDKPEEDPSKTYVMYLQSKYELLGPAEEEGKVRIKAVASGQERTVSESMIKEA